MIIHTVKAGDTVFGIARKYGQAPQKIIENNELQNPDRLTVGEKLLIFTPTRTYTARGADKLSDIAERFGVSTGQLKRKNPQLGGKEKLYPGEILTVKTAEPTYGLGIANGYLYRGAPRERFELTLPYLSYLTVGGAKIKGGTPEVFYTPDAEIKLAKENKTLPLLRIYDGEVEFSDEKREAILNEADRRGYGGVTLGVYNGMKSEPERTEEHIAKLREMAAPRGMKIFAELDGNRKTNASGAADAYILFYDKCNLREIPSFEDGEESAYRSYGNTGRTERTFIDISSPAFSGDEIISKNEAVKRAYGAGKNIDYDPSLKISSFEYHKYLGGKRETVRVAYESPENIKAKLDLAGGLGFMGISFDISCIPIEYLLMFDELYNIPDAHPDM